MANYSHMATTEVEVEIDRLSALPDDLLLPILLKLCDRYPYDTKEAAAKTATLSKRWRFLWTKLPLFAFRSADHSKDEIGRCISRVGEALAARIKASLDLEHYYGFSLYLSLGYDDAFSDDLVALLDFAAESCRVRDVSLHLSAVSSRFSLTEKLYSCASLRYLSLNYLKLVPPQTSVEWGLMTHISLYYVELPQQAIDRIISGCPLLICLKVDACWGFNRLDVRGRRFRELHVRNYWSSELLEISAPCTTSMDVHLNPRRTTLRLTDVSSVEQLRIGFYFHSYNEEKETEMFWNNKQLLQLLRHVIYVVLDFKFIQVVSNMMREDGRKLPQFMVRHLIIEDYICTCNIFGVLAILESSPSLEKLVIHDRSHFKDKCMDWIPNIGADLICDLSHLKIVEIRVYFDHELYITLAQILLRRALVLEEMVIIIEGASIESEDCIKLVKKFETLLTYPKSSHKALVHIKVHNFATLAQYYY